MSELLAIVAAVLAGGGIGAALAWWRLVPRREAIERLARRGHVVHELAEGDVENVAEELERIAEVEPNDATVFLALAALDRRRGRVERAKALHRTVLASAELAPELRVAGLVGLGRDLLAQGNEQAAVGALTRAISLAPRSVATLESLAQALEQAGAWERAAAAWERHEKLAPARRRRQSRIGRGHAIAGQALAALHEGDPFKARKLVERALELAPDSGHVWTARARVAAAAGAREEALEAWQRAWELAPAGAQVLTAEAWSWAMEEGAQDELLERMQASLRTANASSLVAALAERVARRDPDQAAVALARVASRSPAAALGLIRLRLAQGPRDAALDASVRDAAMKDITPPMLVCRQCAAPMARFGFRCSCGAWDSAVAVEDLGPRRGHDPGRSRP
ncbi:tetratricopeptide repeat protein [Nannocystis sp. ILAH1]|uniref:tetratricopeptide repeat protein n=1 Tax=Nannocystis sp. ILAH1 TaxID=2996789 RepID=UPI00226F66FD|nr:tetratricopeptide repeat protein [Nannocystis sp. ILAH1]MCY0993163.1 tetratricopeptide repeat protein [Nannocystis sp. ILAH1]